MSITNRRSRGFTLIEAMIAAMILSLCVVALSSSMVASSQQTVGAAAKISSLSAAQLGMETLIAHPLGDLYSSTGGAVQMLPASVFPTQSNQTTQGKVTFVSRSVKQGARDLAIVEVTSLSIEGPSVTLYRLASKEGNGQ